MFWIVMYITLLSWTEVEMLIYFGEIILFQFHNDAQEELYEWRKKKRKHVKNPVLGGIQAHISLLSMIVR